MRHLCLLGLMLLAFPAFGQFRAFPAKIHQEEGGDINALTIVSDADRFSVRQPAGFSFRIDPLNKSVVFKTADDKTAITVRVTTNYPGQLPDQETLKAQVLQDTPGATVIMESSCPTGVRPSPFFDLVRNLREGISIRFRHVYVACPNGVVELVFATDSSTFDKDRFIFSNFANSFRIESAGK
jgi:hypothetical protein